MKAFRQINKIVSKKELDNKIDRAVEDIKKKIKNKKVYYCWSGGKDAQAMQFLCNLAGVKQGILIYSDLEYPSFMRWVASNKSPNVELVHNGYTYEWLKRNQNFLFADLSNRTKEGIYYGNNFIRGPQHKFIRENKVELMIYGRRLADNNFCGSKKDGYVFYSKNLDVYIYSPMAEWTNEETLALLHYYNIDLPPYYYWKDGFTTGTHPWFKKRTSLNTHADHWNFLMIHEPEVIYKASEYFETPRKMLGVD